MLRALVAVMAIVAVVALGVFGPRWLMSDDPDPSDQSSVDCNLLNHTCEWTQQGTRWQAQLVKDGIQPEGDEYRLTIRTNQSPPRMLAVLRGESMYLGEYPVPMTRAAADPGSVTDTWQAQFTAPLCSTEPNMTWRIDLQESADKVMNIPLKLTFQAGRRS